MKRISSVVTACSALALSVALPAADEIPTWVELVDLTRPVAEGGVITADSTGGNNGAAAAFDDNISSDAGRWLVGSQGQPCHVTYDFGVGTNVTALKVYNGDTGNSPASRAVKRFTVSASDDNATWTTVYVSGDEVDWARAEVRYFSFPNSYVFRYWKFEALAPVSSGEYIQIHELELFNVLPFPGIAEATVLKGDIGVVLVSGRLTDAADGTVKLVLTGTSCTNEFEVGTYAAGASFSRELPLTGISLDEYYAAKLVARKGEGESAYAFAGTYFFGTQRLPVTSYGSNATVNISSSLPLADGNIIAVDTNGVTFKAGNSLYGWHSSIQADGPVTFSSSNIGIVGLTADNRFSAGLNPVLSELVVASHAVIGGPTSTFLKLPHLAIVDGFMTSFSGHAIAKNTSSLLLDLQKPGTDFLVDFDVAYRPNDAGNAAVSKFGPGRLTLAATQTYKNEQPTYGTFLNGGELLVDGTRGAKLYQKKGGSVAFGAGVLVMRAAKTGTTDFGIANAYVGAINGQQNYNNTGGGVIRLDANGGDGATMGLSNLVYTAGSKGPRGRYLGLETVGNATFHTTSANDAAGALLDHRVVLNGADWAAADAGGSIRAFANYVTDVPAADDATANLSLSGANTVPSSLTVASLKLSSGASLEIAVDETLTLASGAILKTGNGDVSISGGKLMSATGVSGSWSDLLVVTEGSGSLTIDTSVSDNASVGACYVTKAGKGTLRFSDNAVGFTKSVIVLDGVFEVGSETLLGGSGAYIGLQGGTLKVTEDMTTKRTILSGGSGAYIDVVSGKVFTASGASVNGYPLGGTTSGAGAGGLHLCNSDGGDGVFVAGYVKCAGGIFIDCGVYRMGRADAVNTAGINPLYFGTGAVTKFQTYGFSGTVAGLYGGTSSSVLENAANAVSTLTIATGGLCDFKGEVRDGGAKALNLVKYGCGRQMLSGPCSYTGSTRVSNGTLAINGAHTGNGMFEVVYPGVIGGTGTVSSAVSLLGGGRVAAGNGDSGKLTLGGLACDGDSVLEVSVDEYGLSRVNVTGDASVVGTVSVKVPETLVNTPCRGVILHAEGSLSVAALKLDTPKSKLNWKLSVKGNDLVLSGMSAGLTLFVR